MSASTFDTFYHYAARRQRHARDMKRERIARREFDKSANVGRVQYPARSNTGGLTDGTT